MLNLLRKTTQPPTSLKLKRYLFWGSASDQKKLRTELEDVQPDAGEVKVLTVGDTHYIYFIPNSRYWQRLGLNDASEAGLPGLWHALPA